MAQFSIADIPVGSGTYSGTQWGNHNNSLVAHVLSQGIGATRPTRAAKGMLWAQQGSGVINILCFDGGADILIGTVNEAANTFTLAGLQGFDNRIVYPNGLIDQWILVGPIGSGANATASFPVTFPNAVRAVTFGYANTATNGAAGQAFVPQVRTLTNSSITVRNLGPETAQYYCRAIGN